jgi:chromosome segregation ATPase
MDKALEDCFDRIVLHRWLMAAEEKEVFMADITTIRAHIDALQARCEKAEAAISRVTVEVAEWRKDANDHMNTWGQHHPASLVVMAERIDAAIAATRQEPT